MMFTSSNEHLPILPLTRSGIKQKNVHPLPILTGYLALFSAVIVLCTVLITPFQSRNLLPVTTTTTALATPSPPFPFYRNQSSSLLSLCHEHYLVQELDHFRANQSLKSSPETFNQRYFICQPHLFNPVNGSIFIYLGNEADVTLYLNHTGLLWENAATFHALLVFAEHRYFGHSIPFGLNVLTHPMEYLSTQQTLADYAILIETIKEHFAPNVPVIGFGGSYGGMLATWFRMKYPHLIDGIIASSAPVLGFLGDQDHPMDPQAFNRGVTFDMSIETGASSTCSVNLRRAFKLILDMKKTKSGRHQLTQWLRLCDEDVVRANDNRIITYAMEAYGYLAMGNYPYPTSYIMDGKIELPSYPMRVACEPFAREFTLDEQEELIQAFRQSVAVYYNATKTETCFFPIATVSRTNESDTLDAAKQAKIDQKGNFWGYLECSELYMPTSSDGVNDVFPAIAVNQSRDDADCFEQWGVHLKPHWAHTEYGGIKALRAASNIVFSNGNFDPWSGLGVLESLSPSVVAVSIPGGAHHLDLFFTHPLDPPAVTEARKTELAYVRQWIEEFYANKRKNAKIDLLRA